MLLKLAGSIIICICTWLLGKSYSQRIRDKILRVDQYILLAQNFKSAVGFSGKNMFDFFQQEKDELCVFASKNRMQEIKWIIDKYACRDAEEKKCVVILSEAFIVAEECSDVENIVDLIENAINRLKAYKRQLSEELYGKIKTAPSIGAMIGLFIAVLIV